jgi:ubiquinone/menaquinone biosynthesis C-methylase UbiE
MGLHSPQRRFRTFVPAGPLRGPIGRPEVRTCLADSVCPSKRAEGVDTCRGRLIPLRGELSLVGLIVGEVNDRYVPAAGRRVFTPLYDAVNAVAMRQGRWRPRLVERALDSRALSSPAPLRILDLGCGTGEMALAIARASPAVQLIGVDGDPDILERAALKARAAGIGLELHEALADRLPLPDANVDCVVSTLMFHHLAPSAKRAALTEARRVLVPGGRLLICDIGRASDPLMRAAFFAVQLLDGFPNTRAHARGELPEIVSQSGFSPVTVFARYRTGGGTLDLIEALR